MYCVSGSYYFLRNPLKIPLNKNQVLKNISEHAEVATDKFIPSCDIIKK